MFVPIPVIAAVAAIVVLLTVQLARLSRRRDPLLGAPPPVLRVNPFVRQDTQAVAAIPALPAEIETRARALVAAGRKIDAIKLVRDATRLGLKESKDLVDELG